MANECAVDGWGRVPGRRGRAWPWWMGRDGEGMKEERKGGGRDGDKAAGKGSGWVAVGLFEGLRARVHREARLVPAPWEHKYEEKTVLSVARVCEQAAVQEINMLRGVQCELYKLTIHC